MRLRKIYLLLAIILLQACSLPWAPPLPTPVPPTSTFPPPTPTSVGMVEPTAAVVVELPVNTVQISGVAYQAYQAPGDPFRFVCPSPCAGHQGLIFSQYAGFKSAREGLLKVTGVDVLRELQPVEIHLSNDPKCGTLKDATRPYSGRGPDGKVYLCTFIFENAQGPSGQLSTPDVGARLDQQTTLIHEYLRAIFFGRVDTLAGALNDLVTPIALYVTGTLGTPDLCSSRPLVAPGDYGGWLIYNLCLDDGFTIDSVAPTLAGLDRLYRRDDGKLHQGFQHPVPTMAQFRDVLNHVLGKDTSQAWRDACWPAYWFEDTYTLRADCVGPTPTIQPTQAK